MKTIFFAVLMICTFGFFLTGCQQDDSDPQIESEQTTGQYDKRVYELSKDPKVQAELQFMKDEMGVDLSSIEIIQVGDYKGSYSRRSGFDGMLIRREGIQMLMKEHREKETNNMQARHTKGIYNFIVGAGAKNIRYISSPVGAVPTNWRTAINNARQKWNGLGKSLTFNTPTAGSYASNTVNVSYQSLSARFGPAYMTTTAYTLFPIKGEAIGPELIINSDVDLTQNLSANQKIYVMVHELGHSMGFEHTDDLTNGTLIVTGISTCDNNSDTQSVLRKGTSPVKSWPTSGIGFSYCDQKVFDLFYGLLA